MDAPACFIQTAGPVTPFDGRTLRIGFASFFALAKRLRLDNIRWSILRTACRGSAPSLAEQNHAALPGAAICGRNVCWLQEAVLERLTPAVRRRDRDARSVSSLACLPGARICPMDATACFIPTAGPVTPFHGRTLRIDFASFFALAVRGFGFLAGGNSIRG